MSTNRYIMRLIKMYQNSYIEELNEILKSKPENWDECKEYFKAWINKLLVSEKALEFAGLNYRRGGYNFINDIREYIIKRLDDNVLS